MPPNIIIKDSLKALVLYEKIVNLVRGSMINFLIRKNEILNLKYNFNL